MPFAPAAMIVAATALTTAVKVAKLHTADPGTAGTANLTTAGSQTIAWTAPTNDGDFDLSVALTFTGGAGSGPATWVSLWNTGATVFYGKFQLTGDQSFNAAGEYVVTSIAQNGSAT